MENTSYGKTWWGKQWLDAFYELEQNNRVSKGLVLASKNAVYNFKINKEGLIQSKIKENTRSYQQVLQALPLKTRGTEFFLNTLSQSPELLAQLLNKQLPTELLALGQKKNIHLLPKSWKDINLACSCSDLVVPCKHIAALIHTIAHKIDQNPFLLFQIRGLDLIKELQTRGVSIEPTKQLKIPSLKHFTKKSTTTQDFDIALSNSIDFSVIQNRLEQYLQLLSEQQPFSEKDIKPILKKNYKKAYKYYQNLDITRHQVLDYHQKIKASNELALIVNNNLQAINLFAIQGKQHSPLFPSDKVIETCVEVLETIPEGALIQYPDYFIALHTIYRFSIKLLNTHNYLPRLVTCSKGHTIQWIPAYNIDNITKRVIQQLVHCCPSDLLLLDNKELTLFQSTEQIHTICSLFIGYFMQQATEIVLTEKLQTKIQHCFFSNIPTVFNTQTEKAIPNQLQTWLNQFYMGNRPYRPILKVEEIIKPNDNEFCVTILVEDSLNSDQAPLPLSAFLEDAQYASHRAELLGELNTLSHYYTDLAVVLSAKQDRTKSYSGYLFAFILLKTLPVIQLLNIHVLLPHSLRRLIQPKLGLAIKEKEPQKEGEEKEKETGQGFMKVGAMLQFQWQVALGNQLLSAEEFLELVEGKSGIVKLKDLYVHLDQEAMRKLRLQLAKPPKISPAKLIQAALSEQYQNTKVSVSAEVQAQLQSLQIAPKILPPEGLKATLRPYQQVGYAWMYKNTQLGLGSLIADDMGLGKTLQIITLLLRFKEDGCFQNKQALIIVPTSLLTNWIREIQKFAPTLTAAIYHGSNRKYPKKHNLVITTYGLARTEQKLLNQQEYYCLVIDEAQNIKNTSTAQTKAIKGIKAEFKIAMSGTPVENRLAEYWSIMDFVNQGYLGELNAFAEEYAKPIQQDNDQQKLEAFQKITAPFILRRLKTDKSIIQDLPDKIETNYYAGLEDEQAAIYQNVVNNTMQQIREAQTEDDGGAKKRMGLVLKLMGALKQVCNHPYQYLGKGSQFAHLSGKSKLLIDLLDKIQQQKEKVLIFTQYQKMGRLMLQWLEERYGRKPLYLHGGTPRKQRDLMVDAFQNNKQDNIFILSLKAAGTGLNLTAANHVIHYDLWWNPAVEAQATDRAYRIGQKKNVQVYRFISKGTLEENIDNMIQSKKQLADSTVFTGSQWVGDLSDTALNEWVRLEI
ncbi:MAG: DEAD/DEAH box helicase [Aureispira sp.]|nr:DEAD/DEAH box helicase [Aureispira sp.]